MSQSSLSVSVKYLCYGSTAIRNILNLSVRGQILYVRICRDQEATFLDLHLIYTGMTGMYCMHHSVVFYPEKLLYLQCTLDTLVEKNTGH